MARGHDRPVASGKLTPGPLRQLLNYSSLAADCGISQPSAKAWLSVLEASFIVFRLPAFHANLRKRLVKMPKLHFHDTGLACWLLGIRQSEQLRSHPLRGQIFETWVVSETFKHRTNRGRTGGLWSYRDRNGAEVDLVIDRTSGLTLVEAKSSSTASSSLFAGARRVRRQFDRLSRPCDLVVAYGGEQFQQRADARLIPWRMLRAAGVAHGSPVVTVLAGGRPISGADILALFPNRTWNRAVTGEYGEAVLDLHAVHLPMTVFVAADGFSAHLERGWTPAERTLHVELNGLPGGGAVIFPEGAGAVPGLAGRLNPIRDTLDRTWVYSDNIAVDDSRREPHPFVPGDDLRLTDADGAQRLVRILDVVGRSALVEYRPRSSDPMPA